MDLRRLGIVCDQFDEIVAHDDASRRRREVDAQLEPRAIYLARIAFVVRNVVEVVLHAAQEAQTARVAGFFEHPRVEPRHVARRERIAHKLHRESRLAARGLGETRRLHQGEGGVGPHLIILYQTGKHRIRAPFRFGKAFVAGEGRRRGAVAAQTPEHVQPDVLLGHREAGHPGRHAQRIHHHVRHDGPQRVAERRHVESRDVYAVVELLGGDPFGRVHMYHPPLIL